MVLTREKQTELAACLLDMGALLLGCGAEIGRVEDTLCRMGSAYGAADVEVFVIPSLITLSMEFSDGEAITDTRRILSSGTNFALLETLNALSRSCCREPIPTEALREKLSEASKMQTPARAILLGSVLAAGSFTVFFGGGLFDALAAVLFAFGIVRLQRRLGATQVSAVGEKLLLSLLSGLGVGLLCRLLPVLHADKILIGDIMLLIPGLAITNAIQNILSGNTISGVVRLTESLIWAGALAGGFMTAMLLIEMLV